jgi:hypothetical protein
MKMNIEFRGKDARYYICDLSEGLSLKGLPWGKREFNVFILSFDKTIADSKKVGILIDSLVRRKTDWFDVLGIRAEKLHDKIDRSGVRLGRQKKVGDGSPMTGWFEETTKVKDMAEHIWASCGDNIIIVILGSQNDFNRFVKAMKNILDKE